MFGLKRREFITLLGGAAATICRPLPLGALETAKVYRIGFLWDGPTVFPDAIEAFRRGLRDLGYVEGRNIAIEYRWAHGKPERMRELAAELVGLQVIGVYVLAGELAAAAGAYQAAFRQYEKEMRPFVMLNQELGLKAANLMKSKERKNLLMWLLDQMMRIAPGRMMEFFINRSTRRIRQAANAIALKDYAA